MKPTGKIAIKGGFINCLCLDDIHAGYIDGLNNKQVNRFLDVVRTTTQTRQSVETYVNDHNSSQFSLLWGIWSSEYKDHIGTVSIHSLDFRHGVGSIGVCIFDVRFWGLGFATEAIRSATNYVFVNHSIRWLEAQTWQFNIGSKKAFLNAGYEWICDINGKYLFEGKPANSSIFAARNNT